MKGSAGVMIFAESRADGIHPVAFELLGKGRELAGRLGFPLSSVLMGSHAEESARELIYHGADRVYYYDHAVFKDFDLFNCRHNVVRLLKEVKPEIFLLGATHQGRSLGPRIAAALGTGLTADCTGLEIDPEGNFVQVRPAFSGNILARIRTRTKPQMATVRYKIMSSLRRDTGRQGEIIRQQAEIIPSLLTIIARDSRNEANITEAEVIVSGGAGLRKASDFRLLSDLAGLLGGTVGASRLPVDNGWIGKEHQVGFSGHTVKPGIYIACGVSGSPQHLAGMRESDIIIAINSDPSAPIFKIADYGIIGDLYEVVPGLIDRIKTERCH